MAEGLGFGLLGSPQNLQTADYRSAGSHQAENLHFELITDANQWEEIHVVTTGKTLYVSAIMITSLDPVAKKVEIGTGAAAAEVTAFAILVSLTLPLIITLPTPIKFSSGVRISGRTAFDSDCYFVLIGWEE